MKRIFYFFIIIFGVISCKKSSDNNYLDTAFLQPKDNIYAILDSFVRENNIDNYVYELYVDKQTPHDYLLTIYCGEQSLTKKENDYHGYIPLNYTIVSGKRFDIFSGIERYFRRENDTIVIDLQDNYFEKKIWIVKDNYDTISVFKELQFPYPFTPLPANFPNEVFNPSVHRRLRK